MAYSREKALDSAQRYLSRGQFAKAAAAFQAVVDHEPGDLRIWLRLANAHLRSGAADQAVECFIRVGAAYEESEDLAKALSVYRQAAGAEPGRLDVVYKCAELYKALGRTAECVESYEHIAQAHLNRGEAERAISLYAHVVKLEPRSVSRRLRLAEIFSREQRVDEAVTVFLQACDMLLHAQDYPQYIRVAERLLYHRQIDEVSHELVRIYLKVNQPRRALVKLNALLQKNHSDYTGLELLAETFLMMGREEKAMSVIVELARAARGKGVEAQEAASRAVLRALDEMPDNPELLRIGNELSASMPDSTSLKLVNSPGSPHPQGYDEDLAGSALDEIDAGQLAGLALGEVEGEDQAGQGLPLVVATAMTEVRVLAKYGLLDHAKRELAKYERDYAQEPELVMVQALLIEAQGDAEGAYQLCLGLAMQLQSSDPHGAALLVNHILQSRPEDQAALALQDRLGGPDAAPVMQAADTAPYDAVLPAAQRNAEQARALDAEPAQPSQALEPEGPQGPFEIEIDAEPGTPAVASPYAAVTQTQPSNPSPQKRSEISLEIDLSDGVPAPTAEPVPERDTRPHPAMGTPQDSPQSTIFDELSDPVSPIAQAFSPEPEPEIEIEELDEFEEIEEIEDFEVEELEDLQALPLSTDPSPAAPKAEYSAEAAAVESLGDEPTNEEINELRFFLQNQLQDEAAELFADLRVRFGDTHPALSPYFVHFGEAPPQQELLSSYNGAGQERLLSEDEADAALSALGSFDGPEPEPAREAVAPASGPDTLAPPQSSRGRASLAPPVSSRRPPVSRKAEPRPVAAPAAAANKSDEAGGRSAQERFDLALAYRDMGLVPNAVAELCSCLQDAKLRAQAALMLGQLERSRGEQDASLEYLEQAQGWASTPDERQDACYELGLTYEDMSRPEDARRCWSQLPPQYRDVQQRLSRSG